MSSFWIVVSAIIVVAVLVMLARRRSTGIDMSSFANALTEAAEAGESAYKAQVSYISSDRGQRVESNRRGIALARFLSASFPAAAFSIVDAANALAPSIKRDSGISGDQAFNLASGVALMPFGIKRDDPDYALITADTNEVVRDYIVFFENHFSTDPVIALGAAKTHLAPHWQKALELSLGPTEENIHTTQFCTSGLHLFITWIQALGK